MKASVRGGKDHSGNRERKVCSVCGTATSLCVHTNMNDAL